MRFRFIALCIALFCAATSAPAQVSVSIGIGINVPVYPNLVLVPGYPVYYAPGLHANYFFYDGLYWVLDGEHWYMSSWFNGPWVLVAPMHVPYFLLRVPVRYYRAPPPYFRGWRPDAPPRWNQHWGPSWEHQHRDWNKWNRKAVPAPAPLPRYQRGFSGDRYPRAEQQPDLHGRNYRYQPRGEVSRQHYQQQAERRGPAPPQHQPQGPRAERNPPKPGPGAPHERGRGKGPDDDRDRRDDRGQGSSR